MALRWLPPNTTRAPKSSRERELVISSVRSHAASISYPERWKKLSLSDHHTVDPVVAQISRDQRKNTTGRAARQEVKNPASDMGRYGDWFFGGLGSRCEKITDHDIRALDYYLDSPVEQLLWGNGVVETRQDGEVIQAIVRPLDRELVRYAVNHEALLASLVSATTLSIANRHPEVPQIRLYGQRKVIASLRHLRTSLQNKAAMNSIENKVTVYSLCMGALISGDLSAARTHIKVLVNSLRGMQGIDDQHVRLFYYLRTCDIRVALESGERPLSDAGWAPDTFESLLEIVEQIGFAPPVKAQAVRAIYMRTVARGECLRLSQSRRDGVLLGCLEAIWVGLLPPRFVDVVQHYNDTVLFMDQVTRMDETAFWKINMSNNCSLNCLLRLSTYWSDLLNNPLLPRDPVASPQLPDVIASLWIELLVATAYLIQMILHYGEYFAPALSKLCLRLRDTIEREPSLVPFALWDEECSDTPLKTGLYIWILLSGMLASSRDPKASSWFETESIRVMRSAQRLSQVTARSLILPFVLEGLQSDIILLAEKIERTV